MKRVCLLSAFVLFMALFVSCNQPSTDSGIKVDVSTEIKVDEPITIRISEPFTFKAKDNYESVIKRNIAISPKVDYTLEVMNAQTICLRPTAPLPYNTPYKLEVKIGKIADAGSQSNEFEVRTLAPVFTYKEGTLEVDPQNDEKYTISGSIELSDPVKGEEIEKGFSIDKAGVAVVWNHSADGLAHQYTLNNIVPSDKSSQLTVTRNYPQFGRGTDNTSYTIPAKGTFTVVSSELILEPYHLEVVFSSILDKKQQLAEVVKVPGGGVIRLATDGNKLTIYPSVKGTATQKVQISKYIKSAKNSTLEEDWIKNFDIPSDAPSVKLLTKGVILPSSSGMNIYFQSVNYAKARVRAKRIYENNILQYLQNNTISSKNSYIDMVARTVIDTTIVLDEPTSLKLKNINNYGLNLGELIKPQRGAIYKIEIRGVEPLAELPEYYWESDYYFGSYEDYNQRTTNILASDLGVIAKGSDKGEYTFAVSNLIDVTPVSGASVAIYNDVNQKIGEGSTNKDGLVTISLSDDPQTAIVSYKEDKTYVKLLNGTAISMSNFEVGGAAVKNGQKGFIFGERGVWRPGDDIYLTFISMSEEGALPANHPVTAALFNPQGQVVSTLTGNTSANGMYAFNFKTDMNAPTGDWQVEITAGGVKYHKSLKIETVKPNRILMELALADDPLLNADNILGTINARWLVGTPAKDLKTQIELSLYRAQTSFPEYKGYIFEDNSRGFQNETYSYQLGTTDMNGNCDFRIIVPTSKAMSGIMDVVFTNRVFEKSGDFSIDSYRTKISPFKTYIGLSFPEEENAWGEAFLDCEKVHTVKLAAVSPKGAAKSGSVSVGVEIYKIGWNWWWSSSYSGLASYAKDSYNQPYKTFNTTIRNGAGSFELDLTNEDRGYYFVRVVDNAGGHATSKVVYSSTKYGWNENENGENAAKLSISLDKARYKVGETAKITIPSSAGSKALVSIEKGETVLKTFWVNCSSSQTSISLPLESSMTPNVYASVTLVQPHNSTLNDAPIRLFGVQRIDVEDDASHLYPVITMNDKVKPESETTITVSEKNGKAMSYSLAIVDEGLLSLTRFKTPDPWNYFYATEALGVRTWDLYNSVIGAYGARMERLFAIGGDGDAGMIMPTAQAERFKPVSIYLGPFTIKANQKEKHKITLPQYIGNLRVMVVATDGKAQGSSEKNVEVSKPVMVQATLPRVIGTDEDILLPVTVFAMEPNLGEVNVKIEANEYLTVVGNASQTINCREEGEQLVYFSVKGAKKEGVATIKTTAKSSSDSSKEEIEIDVRNPNPPTTLSKVIYLEKGESLSEVVKLAGEAGTNSAKIEASALPPIDLDFRLGYLMNYPHGCIEQTVSAAFPQLYLGTITDLTEEKTTKCENNIKAALAKLTQFARPNGSMSYWPASEYYSSTSFWGTAYAVHFMIEAKAKGYAIPESLFKNAVKFLKESASDANYNDVERAYSLYVLALNGEAQRAAMNRMRESVANIPVSAGWYLAAAYAADNKKDAAKGVISKMSNRGAEKIDRFGNYFDSEERLHAVTAMTYSKLGDGSSAFKALQTLSEFLNDRNHYMSTQSTAWALNAVSDFVSKVGSGNVDVSAKIDRSSISLKSNKSFAESSIDVSDKESVNVELKNNSSAPAYIIVSSTGIPQAGEEVEHSNGLRLAVSYTLDDGRSIDPSDLEQGTDFFVNLVVMNTSTTTDYTNLALTQIFPSGWEIRHERGSQFYQDIRDDRVYSYFDLNRSSSMRIVIKATATYKGRFYLPSTICEAMYDNSINASTKGGWCVVR